MRQPAKPPTDPQPVELLRRRLSTLATDRRTRRADAAVHRVLDMLSDANLAIEAAKGQSSDGLELECGVLDQVWDDIRVVNRRNHLERQGIEVERVSVETTVAGQTFSRSRLRVRF